jgi:biopolymer transport protein ExbD
MHARTLGRPSLRIAACLAAVALAAACDDPKPSTTAPTAKATASAAPTAPAEPPKPKGMPELLVDAMGPYLGGRRVDMKAQDAADKLAKIVKELPIEGKPVTLTVDKKAKTPDVAAVVTELGVAGAPKVLLKTDGRDDLPKEIEVTPEGRISSPAACTVSTMVMKDLSTGIWPYKGGLGKRQRKGLAGPDLSQTGEQLTKEIAACSASVVFFSADEELPWEMAYNLAGTVLKSDEKKKIDTLVLLRTTPVAGRPVKLGKGS